MKFKFSVLLSLCFLLASACHGQVPPPTAGYNIVWTWTAPTATGTWSGCSTSLPCSYILSAETITGTTCDPTTSANYKQLNSASPATTTTYTQTGTTGTTVCAVVTTVWNGENSQPSTASAPVTSPAVPLAPGAPSGNSTVAKADKPQAPIPVADEQLASGAIPLRLSGHVIRVR